MNIPLVSVILPTHNRALLLRRAIHSVLAQTYQNLELIVVDDASGDDTPRTVQSFDDPRLRYIRLDQNRRAAAARNLGVTQAKGALLSFQDDDDIWLPDKLSRQVPVLLKAPGEVGLNLCAHVQITPNRAAYIGGPEYFSGVRFDRGPFGNFSLVATPGWLLRRECFERVGGFDERMRCWDDWELALRLSKVYRFEHLNEVLWMQDRLRGSNPGMFDNRRHFSNDVHVLIEKHAGDWPARLISRQWYRAGLCEAATSGVAAALPFLRKATQANPWNARAWMALGLARLGDRTWRSVSREIRRVSSVLLPRRTFFDG